MELEDTIRLHWENTSIYSLVTFLTISTVKPVLSGHLKIDKTKVVRENGSLMKVDSIAEC